MLGIIRAKPAQLLHKLSADPLRPDEIRSPMHDAMPDSCNRIEADLPLQPANEEIARRAVIGRGDGLRSPVSALPSLTVKTGFGRPIRSILPDRIPVVGESAW